MNVGDWIKKRGVISSDKTAIIDIANEHECTYGELNDRVNQLTNRLIKVGLKKGDRIALLAYNCYQFMEVYFAAAKIGAIFLPLNWRLRPPELKYMLQDSGTSFLILHDKYSQHIDNIRNSLPEIKKFICLGNQIPSWAEEYEYFIKDSPKNEPEIEEEVYMEDPQVIMYTSGTTGAPKGAVLPHRKTYYNTFNAHLYFNLTSESTMLVVMPLFHSGGLNICTVPTLYVGGTAVIVDSFDTKRTLDIIENYKISHALMVTTMLKFIIKKEDISNYDLSSFEMCMVGGEPVPISLLENYQKVGINLTQGFGQTETSGLTILPEKNFVNKLGSVGLPLLHCDVKVRKENGEDVMPGEVGEIIVKGPVQMLGYWNKPEETAKTIRGEWLYTGDLATIDVDGYIYIVDRERDVIISGGENIYPSEIEKTIEKNKKILECAVIGIVDEKWGESPKALIVLQEGEEMDDAEIVEFLNSRLASFKMPKLFQFVSEFPKTASGKVKKHELRKKYGGIIVKDLIEKK